MITNKDKLKSLTSIVVILFFSQSIIISQSYYLPDTFHTEENYLTNQDLFKRLRIQSITKFSNRGRKENEFLFNKNGELIERRSQSSLFTERRFYNRDRNGKISSWIDAKLLKISSYKEYFTESALDTTYSGWHFEYDENDNLIRKGQYFTKKWTEEYALDIVTEWCYNDSNQLIEQIQEKNKKQRYFYDQSGKLNKIELYPYNLKSDNFELTRTTDYFFDENSRLMKMRIVNHRKKQDDVVWHFYAYDDKNNLILEETVYNRGGYYCDFCDKRNKPKVVSKFNHFYYNEYGLLERVQLKGNVSTFYRYSYY